MALIPSPAQPIELGIIDSGTIYSDISGYHDECILHGSVVSYILKTLAPTSHITSYDYNRSDQNTEKDIAESIIDAVNDGMDILSISATVAGDVPELSHAMDIARQEDVLIVASAGNTSEKGVEQNFPAAFPDALGVGAVQHSDDQQSEHIPAQVVADYSLTGEHVNVYAYGGPYSFRLPSGENIIGIPTPPLEGTSFATPVVAAAAVIAKSFYPELSAAQLKTRVIQCAEDESPIPIVTVRRTVQCLYDSEGTSASEEDIDPIPGQNTVEYVPHEQEEDAGKNDNSTWFTLLFCAAFLFVLYLLWLFSRTRS